MNDFAGSLGTTDQEVLPQVLPADHEWLLSNIRRVGGRLDPVPSDAESSTKGSADLFSLFLPDRAAISSVVQVIKLWLKERGRAITFQVTKDGETSTYQLASAVSDATVREVLSHAVIQDQTPGDTGK